MIEKIQNAISLIFNINWWEFPYYFFHKPILIRLFRKNLKFYTYDFRDALVFKEVIIDENYEKYHQIKRDDIVIDIGAGLGDFSIYASLRAKKVFAFEMDKKRLEMMKKNIATNARHNIHLFHEEVRSLNALFQKHNIKKCQFLKVDCEGGEYEIFQQATRKTLAKIAVISMEAHLFNREMQKNYLKLIAFLKENHFQIFQETPPGWPHLRFVYASH